MFQASFKGNSRCCRGVLQCLFKGNPRCFRGVLRVIHIVSQVSTVRGVSMVALCVSGEFYFTVLLWCLKSHITPFETFIPQKTKTSMEH